MVVVVVVVMWVEMGPPGGAVVVLLLELDGSMVSVLTGRTPAFHEAGSTEK